MKLNKTALMRCQRLIDDADMARISVLRDESGAQLVDCGVHVLGGLQAGQAVAEVCLAGLGRVELTGSDPAVWRGPAVSVQTDQPVAACMASQYAGWPILRGESFFGMGSGPMRALRGREALFETIGLRETSSAAIGVIESSRLPEPEICRQIADECELAPEQLTLLIAPSTSIAGTMQVTARTVETALHKMHELGFDLDRVVSGFGVAPLPPVAADVLVGIGRMNDAVLYGGQVTLWVRGEDESLHELGPRIPSCASVEHGEPFAHIFARNDGDFYKIDPLLFSPAIIELVNLDSGNRFQFGELSPRVLQESFED